MSGESRKTKILLGATGSVAAIKLPLLAHLLLAGREDKVEIKVVHTPSAEHFLRSPDADISNSTWKLLQEQKRIFTDRDEWAVGTVLHRHGVSNAGTLIHSPSQLWTQKLDPVLHIDVRLFSVWPNSRC
jgi:hypothetical protein